MTDWIENEHSWHLYRETCTRCGRSRLEAACGMRCYNTTSLATLVRRMAYGGKKGRAAARRIMRMDRWRREIALAPVGDA